MLRNGAALARAVIGMLQLAPYASYAPFCPASVRLCGLCRLCRLCRPFRHFLCDRPKRYLSATVRRQPGTGRDGQQTRARPRHAEDVLV